MSRKMRRLPAIVCTSMALAACVACTAAPSRPSQRTFRAPEEAVQALTAAVKKGDLDEVVAIFGPDGQELIDSSDPASARRSREVFTIAAAEGSRLVDAENGKTLVIGNEGWPFPVPLVEAAGGWRFDTAAGKEEVLVRRIGRNELAAIRACRTYVAAQRLYARRDHDGKPAGLYAQTFRSDSGRQNGLYWAAARGQARSPLGDLMTEAADVRPSSGSDPRQPAPFHGYYFKILKAQGRAAPGGVTDYLVDGEMSRGFGLVAWPAQYDVTGVMTFAVNQHGIVYQQNLGPGTGAAARAITLYDPDASWSAVE